MATVAHMQTIALPTNSDCVEEVRRRKVAGELRESTLRNIRFGPLQGDEAVGGYSLFGRASDRPVGEAFFRKVTSSEDPTASYLLIRLGRSVSAEAIAFKDDERRLMVFWEGKSLGGLVEEEIIGHQSWWRRVFARRRLWHVRFGNGGTGRVCLQYPVSRRSRLYVRCDNGVYMPIQLGSVWFRPRTRYVIPPDTPKFGTIERERMHFMLAIVFRTLIICMDQSSDN